MINLLSGEEKRKQVAIRISDLWEKFRLYHERSYTLKDILISFRHSSYEDFWALKGITLEVMRGEMLGIVGDNGSGKSTLLKCIANIFEPTRGKVEIDGKISALLELGAGFHPDLTGRENIFLNGSILGLTKKEIKECFDEIVGFAELEHFIDTPVRNYSSGMYVRLGFAIAVYSNPNILIIDEVLSVGDIAFQRKCLDKIQEFKKLGTTIVLVSHDLWQIRALCDRAVLISNGELRIIGRPQKVIDCYINDSQVKIEGGIDEENHLDAESPADHVGSGEIEIVDVEMLDEFGQRKQIFHTGEKMTVKISYEAHKDIRNPFFGINATRTDGLTCFSTSPWWEGCPEKDISEGVGKVMVEIPTMRLLGGRYILGVGIYSDEGVAPYDVHTRACVFSVETDKRHEGVFLLEANWKFEE